MIAKTSVSTITSHDARDFSERGWKIYINKSTEIQKFII